MEDMSVAWVARIVSVEDGTLRSHLLAEDLHRLPPDTIILMLADIQFEAARADADAGRFMMAFQDILIEDMLDYARKAVLYKEAADAGVTSVQRLMLAPPARNKDTPKPARKQPEGSDTLGMKTWRARRVAGQELEKLARDADPRVIHNVLLNPRMTEPEVVRLASKRPVAAAVLVEIARSAKWSRRMAVRRALVFNPYTPTALALRLLPFMTRGELLGLTQDTRVHIELARQAASFVSLRPPEVLVPDRVEKPMAPAAGPLDAAEEAQLQEALAAFEGEWTLVVAPEKDGLD